MKFQDFFLKKKFDSLASRELLIRSPFWEKVVTNCFISRQNCLQMDATRVVTMSDFSVDIDWLSGGTPKRWRGFGHF